jgi:hypothetical protein
MFFGVRQILSGEGDIPARLSERVALLDDVRPLARFGVGGSGLRERADARGGVKARIYHETLSISVGAACASVIGSRSQ